MIYPTPLFCWGFGFGGEKRRVHPWHFFHGTCTLRLPTSQKRLHPPGQWENRWSDGRGVPQGGLVFPQCHWIPLMDSYELWILHGFSQIPYHTIRMIGIFSPYQTSHTPLERVEINKAVWGMISSNSHHSSDRKQREVHDQIQPDITNK